MPVPVNNTLLRVSTNCYLVSRCMALTGKTCHAHLAHLVKVSIGQHRLGSDRISQLVPSEYAIRVSRWAITCWKCIFISQTRRLPVVRSKLSLSKAHRAYDASPHSLISFIYMHRFERRPDDRDIELSPQPQSTLTRKTRSDNVRL